MDEADFVLRDRVLRDAFQIVALISVCVVIARSPTEVSSAKTSLVFATSEFFRFVVHLEDEDLEVSARWRAIQVIGISFDGGQTSQFVANSAISLGQLLIFAECISLFKFRRAQLKQVVFIIRI